MAEDHREDAPADSAEAILVAEEPSGPPPQYWLRVHGYPSDLTSEVVYYGDFADLLHGRLAEKPSDLLKIGDVIIYYADGPASLYGWATIVDHLTGPVEGPRRRKTWTVPIKRESIIRVINKAPHAVGLTPPSGHHFLSMVRDFTYIRLPEEDGVYLVGEVKARASTRE